MGYYNDIWRHQIQIHTSVKKEMLLGTILDQLFPHLAGTNEWTLHSVDTLREISLDPMNAVEVDTTKQEFTVGATTYKYGMVQLPPHRELPGSDENFVIGDGTYDVHFHPVGNPTSMKVGGKENVVKIYTTMFKVILDFIQRTSPNTLLISSFDASGYYPIYDKLINSNKVPGYRRAGAVKWNYPNKGPITSIILQKEGIL